MESLRLLVADDEEVVRALLAEMSESLGHRVVAQAADGEQAIALAESCCPDLILLDIYMPKIDGLRAAQAITARKVLPIVIVTAYADDALIQRAAEAGAFGYLVKPITRERLVAAIATARARFADLQVLRSELGDLKEALEARKTIERAKGVLMRDLGVNEQEAYRWLKRASSHHNEKLSTIAQRIVALESVKRD